MTHEKSTVFVVRILAAFISVTGFSIILLLNLMSANVIHSAHKSYPLLYKFLLKNHLSLKEVLKIESFIAHLSDREIGFYCKDMFAMNIENFLDYISVCFGNYFLIMSNL